MAFGRWSARNFQRECSQMNRRSGHGCESSSRRNDFNDRFREPTMFHGCGGGVRKRGSGKV